MFRQTLSDITLDRSKVKSDKLLWRDVNTALVVYLVIYHDLAKVKCSQKLLEPSYSEGAITQMSTFGVYSKYHTPGGTWDFSECLSKPKVSTVAQ